MWAWNVARAVTRGDSGGRRGLGLGEEAHNPPILVRAKVYPDLEERSHQVVHCRQRLGGLLKHYYRQAA